jgi:hypothetical protein
MGLLIFIGGLLVLDVLAMRFGVDSRIIDARDRRGWWPATPIGDALHDAAASHGAQLHYEANMERLASLATVGQPSLRIRLAHGLRALAARIEPAERMPRTTAHAHP